MKFQLEGYFPKYAWRFFLPQQLQAQQEHDIVWQKASDPFSILTI